MNGLLFENEAIMFSYTMKKEVQMADFDFELKHLQDHAPLSQIEDYWNHVNNVTLKSILELVSFAPTSPP